MEQLEEHEQHQQSDSISRTDAVSENPLNAIDRLAETYKVPLEGAGTEIDEIRIEFEAMVTYAVPFMSLSTLDYQSVWWRLFHAPNSSEWSNIVILATLLFPYQHQMAQLKEYFHNSIVSRPRSELLLVATA